MEVQTDEENLDNAHSKLLSSLSGSYLGSMLRHATA